MVLNNFVLYLSEFMNISPNAIIYAFFILSTYPLSLFYKKAIGYAFLKHLFSILIGTIMCYSIFSTGDMIIHLLVPSLLSVIISNYVNVKYKPDYIVFALCLLHLSALHIYRLLSSYQMWTVDISGVMMLLVIKLTSYSCDVVKRRKLNLTVPDSQIQNSRDVPNSVEFWIEWLGYIFFFPSFLTGPTLSFEEYKNIANDCNDSSVLKDIQDESEQKNSLLLALVSFVLLVIGMRFFQASYLYSDVFYSHSFLAKIVIMYITLLLVRCKYYFAWSFSKASCIAAGVNIITATNVNIVKVETASNLRTILSNWNICSANWLKQYVYMRVIEEKYSTTMAIFMTNLVSAFWHGFYPGYYLTFFSSGLLTELGKSIRRKITPIFSDSNFIYNILCNISVSFMLAYMAIPFQVFGFYESYYAWKNLYFVGHFMMVCASVIVYFTPNVKGMLDESNSMQHDKIMVDLSDSAVKTENIDANKAKFEVALPSDLTTPSSISIGVEEPSIGLRVNSIHSIHEESDNLIKPVKPFFSKRNTDDEIQLLSKLRKRNVEKNDN